MLSLAVSLDSIFDVSKSRDWPFGDFLLSGAESFQAGQDYVDGRDWWACRLWTVLVYLCILICSTLTDISGTAYFDVLVWYVVSVNISLDGFIQFPIFSDTLFYCICMRCECYRLYSRALSGLLPRGDLIVESGRYSRLWGYYYRGTLIHSYS